MHKRGQPGCPCCDEPDCGELCITIDEAGEPPTASEGASIDGGTLGTVETDADGKACFAIPGTGTYAFIVTKTGFITERFSVTVSAGDCDGTAIVKAGPTIDPEVPDEGCEDIFIVQCGPCPRPGVTVTFRYFDAVDGTTLMLEETYVTKWDGRFRVCYPPENLSGEWILKVLVPGDDGPQTDNYPASPFTEIHFVTGETIVAYSATHQPYWFCYPGEPNRCMAPFPGTITVTISSVGAGSPTGTHELTLILNGGLSADYRSTARQVTGGGTWYEVFVRLPYRLDFGRPCGEKPTADLNASLFLYPDATNPTPSSTVSFTPDTAFPTKACPINFRFFRVISGVPFPDENMVFTP